MKNWLEGLTGATQSRLMRLLRRSAQSITTLAAKLGMTDNAVRTHVATLDRLGIVEESGVQRDTGGKPARLYGLTREGEELFPKAYALVLGKLIEELVRTEGEPRAIERLREVGRALAGTTPSGNAAARRAVAVQVFASLGADVELLTRDGGWELQGYGCPLASVSSTHPQMCAMAEALIAAITGTKVTECCQREGNPRCGFRIAAG